MQNTDGYNNYCWTNILTGTPRYCDVESTSMTLIQRRDNVVCPVGCIVFIAGFKVGCQWHYLESPQTGLRNH